MKAAVVACWVAGLVCCGASFTAPRATIGQGPGNGHYGPRERRRPHAGRDWQGRHAVGGGCYQGRRSAICRNTSGPPSVPQGRQGPGRLRKAQLRRFRPRNRRAGRVWQRLAVHNPPRPTDLVGKLRRPPLCAAVGRCCIRVAAGARLDFPLCSNPPRRRSWERFSGLPSLRLACHLTIIAESVTRGAAMRFGYPIPKTDDDFQHLCCRLLRRHWNRPYLQPYAHRRRKAGRR